MSRILSPTRRHLLKGAAVTLAAPALITRAAADTSDPAVDQGLAYFRDRAQTQLALCQDLTAALKTGDPLAARNAYAIARPPYEEIEVHAGAFPQIDVDIDARPYAIEGGETSDAFRGFHKIEAMIFRDGDIEGAVPVAEQLERTVEALLQALSESSRFSASLFFEGLVALPEEVAAKKISSEEETWSDLSLVIFRHNFVGVESQFSGFVPELTASAPETVDRAKMAFMTAHAVLEPWFEGGGVTPYSDVRAAERGQIVSAAYAIRDAMQEAAEKLALI